MELTLAGNVVGDSSALGLQSGVALGVEDLSGVLGEVELDGEVVEDTLGELGLEELGDGAGVDVAEELEGVGVGGVLAKDGTGLKDDLVGAEVGALEEDKLVLVGQVQGTLGILHQAEVEGLDALGGGILSVVAEGQHLSAAEADLNVGLAGSEDRLVVDGDLERLGGVDVELGEHRC